MWEPRRTDPNVLQCRGSRKGRKKKQGQEKELEDNGVQTRFRDVFVKRLRGKKKNKPKRPKELRKQMLWMWLLCGLRSGLKNRHSRSQKPTPWYPDLHVVRTEKPREMGERCKDPHHGGPQRSPDPSPSHW